MLEPTRPPQAERHVHEHWATRLPFWLLFGPVVAFVVATLAANAFWPTLLVSHPLWLLALHSGPRNLMLTAPLVEPAPFIIVSTLQAVVGETFFYLIGARYGDRATAAMRDRLGKQAVWLDRLQRAFARAAPLVVVLVPNRLVSVLAGVAGMRLWVFLALETVGAVARASAARFLGNAFADPITSLVGVIGEYRWWLTGATVLLVMAHLARSHRRGRDPIEFLEEIEELEDELEAPPT